MYCQKMLQDLKSLLPLLDSLLEILQIVGRFRFISKPLGPIVGQHIVLGRVLFGGAHLDFLYAFAGLHDVRAKISNYEAAHDRAHQCAAHHLPLYLCVGSEYGGVGRELRKKLSQQALLQLALLAGTRSPHAPRDARHIPTVTHNHPLPSFITPGPRPRPGYLRYSYRNPSEQSVPAGA